MSHLPNYNKLYSNTAFVNGAYKVLGRFLDKIFSEIKINENSVKQEKQSNTDCSPAAFKYEVVLKSIL